MANILVLGVDPDSTYETARIAIAAGHNAAIALSREQAFRKVLSGLIDTLVLDTTLPADAVRAIGRQLGRSVPQLPRFAASVGALPIIDRAVTPVGRRTVEMSEPLMRSVAYLFGLIEGRRLGLPTDLEIRCDGVTRVSALTTALNGREAICEFLDGEAQEQLLGLTLLGPAVPATMRLHFPGGGVLRVEGTVEGGVSRRGIVSLKLTATPEQAAAPAMTEHPAEATASDLLAAAISAA